MNDEPSNPANSWRKPAEALFLEVYDELRALAAARLGQERLGHTLQPTALVHEVYLKLTEQSRAHWEDRDHFFAVAAEAIRRVLVDHARGKSAQKRRTPGQRVTVNDNLDAAADAGIDILALDDALNRLAEISPRQARVVELRYFGGLETDDTARLLGISETTVKTDWRIARAWLQEALAGESAS